MGAMKKMGNFSWPGKRERAWGDKNFEKPFDKISPFLFHVFNTIILNEKIVNKLNKNEKNFAKNQWYEPLTHLLQISSKQIAITIISVEELIRARLAQIRKATKSDARVKVYYWLSRTFNFLNDYIVIAYDAKV